jgi:HSP20 family protein
MLKSIWDELEDMNRKFDETFAFWPGFPFRRQSGYLPTLTAMTERSFVPITEVFEQNGDLVVRLELPGIKPEKDVIVTLADGELVIKGERKQEKELADKAYYRFETVYGTFERHFAVPETLDERAVHAEYKDGILEVIVKGAIAHVEAKKQKAKTIPVIVQKLTPELAAKA